MTAPTPSRLPSTTAFCESTRAASRRFTKTLLTVMLAASLALAAATGARAACTTDAQGADDNPGQKDVSQFCNNGVCSAVNNSFSMSFDDRLWTGGNTGDGCLLFDTDGDGNSNRAICGTLENSGTLQAGSPTCYICGDTRPDRCTSPATPVACTTTCSATTTNDPFASDQTHFGNVCKGTNCLTFDSTVTCCVTGADRGGAGGVLIDACSYPSSSVNSDPSDCIVTRECSKNDPNDPVCNDGNPCTVDSCDTGVGVCHHVAGNGGAICRQGVGVCDVAETCTGSSIDCPADGFATGGVCRAANGACDVAESCDGSGPNCPADGVASGGVCRPASGQCDVAESCDGVSKNCPADAPKPNNTACSDGNACTNGDVCVGGVCQSGSATVCNDGNVCTNDSCNPATGACVTVNNGASCSDGNACTTGDVCSGGSCQSGAATTCDDDNPCTDDACNPSNGQCAYTNDNTNACSDGNACTNPDHCSGGQCLGGATTVCNDANPCTDDACDTATGVCDYTDDDTNACSDGNACTNPDACLGGQCQGGEATVCNDGNPCTDQVCNTTTGACDATNNTNDCDDGDPCTSGDVCAGGQCDGPGATDCDDDNACTADSCDSDVEDGCVHAGIAGCCNTNAECADSDFCTENERCVAHRCVSDPVTCDDGNVCTDDACSDHQDEDNDDDGCVYTANSASCTDGNACTNDDVCSGGQCQPGAATICNDGNQCTDDTCNTTSGACVYTNDNSNTCSDDDACTNPDACSGGVCVGGAATVCNDGNPCTDDFCDQNTGACGAANDDGNACSDGNACTGPDACVAGQCQAGDATVCPDDGNPCTDHACNTSSGTCEATNNTAGCSDGNACTGPDVCGGGTCHPGAATVCSDDGNPCTDPVCNTATGGCGVTNNTGPCDDGNACTGPDVCGGGTCHSGDLTVCDDANVCTTDTCNTTSGACVFTANDNPCEDGLFCTGPDYCFDEECVAGPVDPCNDHLTCTDDACVEPVPDGDPGHCEHAPVDHPCCDVDADCADQDGCTINETCVGNSCVSEQVNCEETPIDDPCTIDGCTSLSANDFRCVNQDCSELQNNPCPTDHLECFSLTCGNGVVEAANDETCDPPGSTTTPNGNPCRADCHYCGDGVVNGANETCDDGNSVTGCNPLHPQQAADECQNDCTVALCKDPAKITLAEWIDRYDVHGRLPSSTLVDFRSHPLVIELTDRRGKVLYRTALRVGSLTGDVAIGKFKYSNRTAKISGGLAKVKIGRHKDGYRLTATTYGNLFASGASMVTNVYSGSDRWKVNGNWKPTLKGWKFIE